MFWLSSSAAKGLTYPAHLCYVVAYQEPSFDLIGCERYFVCVCVYVHVWDSFLGIIISLLATDALFSSHQFARRNISHEGRH